MEPSPPATRKPGISAAPIDGDRRRKRVLPPFSPGSTVD
ncbi:hypothetical protein PVAP13_1KG519700 [Panicum virgatum]|uniref:Uncharacterized protein n=1 Tax=Panicum virgatum TaxID=38727 RepID=A0A8T0XVL3_PANVG|nr:hypothetical protein PVAP13_1KG519700 [Panicum virgatum]